MAADTSIVPTGFTVASAFCQYVIGRDNGLHDDGVLAEFFELQPAQYINSTTAEVMFLAQITSPTIITFQSNFGFQETPLTYNLGTTVCTIDAISVGDRPNVLVLQNGNSSSSHQRGRYAPWGPPGQTTRTSGWYYLEAGRSFKLTYTVAVRALGFWGVDLGDWTGNLVLKIYYTDATTENVQLPYTLADEGKAPQAQSMTYFGLVTAKDFDRVDFLNSAPGYDIFGFDNFTSAITTQVSFPTPPPGAPTVEPLPPGSASIACGPSLGPSVCSQSCPIPVPTWVPVVYSVITSGQPTGLTLCGHSLGRQPVEA